MSRVVSSLFILLLSFHLANADKYPKNQGIDVQHYSFSVVLSDESDQVEVESRILLRFKTSGVRHLRLDLVNKSDALKGRGMVVTSVQSGGQDLRFTHADNALMVYFANPSAADSEAEITVRYSGIPADGLIIGPTKFGSRSFFSHHWPNAARHWLSVVDHPYEKATSEFLVTAPARYDVVSNGLLMERTILDDKTKLTHWKQSVPVSAWLYVLAVAEFAVQYVDTFEGKSIETWVYPQNRKEGFYDFAEPTKQALQFFSDYVGPYAYEKVANIQSPSVKGAMETASAVFYQEDAVTGSRSFWLNNANIHEWAHHWFGNCVTESTWDDAWLSEGFATYFTMLFREHAYGRDDFVNELHKAKQDIAKYYAKDAGYKIVDDRSAEEGPVTNLMTYQKGAWILHMLRNLVGGETFKRGIRAYYQKYYNATATTEDLRMEMERASGKDLRRFFDQWLRQGGYIKLAGSWRYDQRKKQVVVKLDQVQDKEYEFEMPIEIGVYTEKGLLPEVTSFQLGSRQNEFVIPVAERPRSVTIDPNTKLLAEWELRNTK